MKRGRLNSIRLVLITAILGLMVLTPIIQAGSTNQGILSPDSPQYGLTYAEWSAKWWQWVYSISASDNPLVDKNGSNAANGQSGPVWFLAGAYCLQPCKTMATANRNVNVPEGKALFFPILNVESDDLNLTPPNGGSPLTYNETQLRAFNEGFMALAKNMIAEVDGVSIKNLNPGLTSPYRTISPVFTYHIPDNNIYNLFGVHLPAQDVPGVVADGVYLMVAPLPIGKHIIHFAGEFAGKGKILFGLNIHYTINVV